MTAPSTPDAGYQEYVEAVVPLTSADPDIALTLGRELAEAQATVEDAQGPVRTALTDLADAWRGEGATEFAEYADQFDPAATALATAFRDAATVLDGVAKAMDYGKRQAQSLNDQVAEIYGEVSALSGTASTEAVSDALAKLYQNGVEVAGQIRQDVSSLLGDATESVNRIQSALDTAFADLRKTGTGEAGDDEPKTVAEPKDADTPETEKPTADDETAAETGADDKAKAEDDSETSGGQAGEDSSGSDTAESGEPKEGTGDTTAAPPGGSTTGGSGGGPGTGGSPSSKPGGSGGSPGDAAGPGGPGGASGQSAEPEGSEGGKGDAGGPSAGSGSGPTGTGGGSGPGSGAGPGGPEGGKSDSSGRTPGSGAEGGSGGGSPPRGSEESGSKPAAESGHPSGQGGSSRPATETPDQTCGQEERTDWVAHQAEHVPEAAGRPHVPGPPAHAPSGTVDQWVDQALTVLRQDGVPAELLDRQDVVALIERESAGDPRYVDWQADEASRVGPPIGLLQTIQPVFDTYHLPGHDDIYNPVDNIVAGLRYALDNYGSLTDTPALAEETEATST